VPRSSVALRFLRDRKHLISGMKKRADKQALYERLMQALQRDRPHLIREFEAFEAKVEEGEAQVRKRRKVWENVVSKENGKQRTVTEDSTAAEANSFKFSFF
jgi:hypothetical protein